MPAFKGITVPDEIGLKDTVKVNVGMITQVVARFDVPANSVVGESGGYEYVNHGHILEHEGNDMMRTHSEVP